MNDFEANFLNVSFETGAMQILWSTVNKVFPYINCFIPLIACYEYRLSLLHNFNLNAQL